MLTPLGLLAGGVAWGEWRAGELGARADFMPPGLEVLGGIWDGIVPDYGSGGVLPSVSYMLSALAGSVILAAVFYIYGRLRWRLKR
jgi:hypothetical protein